jgi:hypothetical protein
MSVHWDGKTGGWLTREADDKSAFKGPSCWEKDVARSGRRLNAVAAFV